MASKYGSKYQTLNNKKEENEKSNFTSIYDLKIYTKDELLEMYNATSLKQVLAIQKEKSRQLREQLRTEREKLKTQKKELAEKKAQEKTEKEMIKGAAKVLKSMK